MRRHRNQSKGRLRRNQKLRWRSDRVCKSRGPEDGIPNLTPSPDCASLVDYCASFVRSHTHGMRLLREFDSEA